MCVIHFCSLTNSFKPFIKNTKLPVYKSHEKGDKSKKVKEEYWDNYGFSCNVSDRDWTDLDGQFKDAEKFIIKHKSEIEFIRKSFDIHDVRFDFPYECRLDGKNIFMQGNYLPASFALLCGQYGIGIALSHYPPIDKKK